MCTGCPQDIQSVTSSAAVCIPTENTKNHSSKIIYMQGYIMCKKCNERKIMSHAQFTQQLYEREFILLSRDETDVKLFGDKITFASYFTTKIQSLFTKKARVSV